MAQGNVTQVYTNTGQDQIYFSFMVEGQWYRVTGDAANYDHMMSMVLGAYWNQTPVLVMAPTDLVPIVAELYLLPTS
jgi:hypothetical protein